MDFLDTAKETAANTIHTVSAFIQKEERDPVEQGIINMVLMFSFCILCSVICYHVGFDRGVLSR